MQKVRCNRDGFFTSNGACVFKIPTCGYTNPFGDPSIAVVSNQQWQLYQRLGDTDKPSTLATLLHTYVYTPAHAVLDALSWIPGLQSTARHSSPDSTALQAYTVDYSVE
uniref:Uncharacterized protein n=1 Tax=Lygus hesperus TaxID=30085 RepID=A0A146LWC9_LYGHE